MKKQNVFTQQSIKDVNKKIYNFLKSISELVKFRATREFGFKALQEIEVEDLDYGLTLYYLYVKGKYYNLSYKDNNNVVTIEAAHDYYSDLFFLAKQNNIQIKNSKYLFVLAHTKFLLTFHCTGKRKEKLIAQARNLTIQGLKINSKNSSFIWLSLQLNA